MENTKNIIQQAIWFFLKENPFAGSLLQELNIRTYPHIPTAALRYEKQDGKFEVLINEEFFGKLTLEQRVAVFHHEILHFTHGHLFRFDKIGTEKDQMKKNLAADMAINQFIPNLPEGCIDHKKFNTQDGKPFPDYQTFERYFELLQQTTNEPKDDKGEQNAEKGEGPEANWNHIKNYKEFDQHDWDQLSEEEKQRLLKEAKRVLTRAVDKTFKDHTNVPDAVKDLLQRINTEIKKMDYKGLLRAAIKKTLTSQDRIGTWYRPNKRYGSYAPGSTNDKVPFINVYIDTSGSISHKELNEFLAVMDGFLKNSSKRCNLGFWHTELYDVTKYKLGTKINEGNIQSGGTDPTCVVEHIENKKPDLSIVLTDGHYDKSRIKLTQKVIWVISKDGNVNHPHANHGRTVKIEG